MPIASEKLIFRTSNSGRANPDMAIHARLTRVFIWSQASGVEAEAAAAKIKSADIHDFRIAFLR
jgi:hypothetical protein